VSAKKEPTLLRHSVLRRIALEACKDFGIPASRVSPAFIRDIEERVVTYVRGQAVSSVDAKKHTIRGGGVLTNELC
jgi:hypothetical protein